MKKLNSIIAIAFCALTLIACSNDDNNSNNNSGQTLVSDFVEVHVQGQKVESIMADATGKLYIDSDLKVQESLARPDTTYRMMMYYIVAEGSPITIYATRPVSVLNAVPCPWSLSNTPEATPFMREPGTMSNDPLQLISAWQSQNKKYVNIVLGVMGGQNDDRPHKIDVVEDSVKQTSINTTEGKKPILHRYLSIRHDQNGLPYYYTTESYISIPVTYYNKYDSISVTAVTFNGRENISFAIK